MTEDDDERMDRARRIREMREGSRSQDDVSSDDTTEDSAGDDHDEVQMDDPTGDANDTDDESVDGDIWAAETDDSDDGTLHVPGADVEDVDVDVAEMAREAGLASAEDSDGEAVSEDDVDTTGSAVTGAANRAAASESDTGEETRVLEFTLGGEQYCLDIKYVEEIVERETVTRVPNTPDCVEGVVDLRGQITTILDPKVLLDIPEAGSTDRIVVFDPDEFDDQGAVGWVVDDVNQVTPVTDDQVNPSPVEQDHVNGVVDRDGELVIWTTPELDLDEVAG
jgi:purine-binding chemotaxis protein CheW